MPIEMSLWRLDGTAAIPVPSSSLDSEQRLERILEEDPSILGLEPLMIIGRQVKTDFGKRIDLLALDAEGDLYAIELKRDRTPREVIAQALDYGSWIQGLGYEEVAAIWSEYGKSGQSMEAALKDRFGEQAPDEVNTDHQLIIVASELDASTERIVDYLSAYTIPINVVFFRYLRDEGVEYLARSWLLSPTEVESRPGRKKRPWNGRDFYVAFGDGPERKWEDAVRFGFVSGGGDPWYSRSLNALEPGHRVFVHLPGKGYIAVGEVVEPSQPVGEFVVAVGDDELPILEAPGLVAEAMDHDAEDPEKCDWVVRVRWLQIGEVPHWEPGLFANQNTAARLRDTDTILKLEKHFGLDSAG
jgi:hypothetical protein